MAAMKESMSKPVRVFKMPYSISCVAFNSFEDNF